VASVRDRKSADVRQHVRVLGAKEVGSAVVRRSTAGTYRQRDTALISGGTVWMDRRLRNQATR
jgi:hypothetical protein